MRQAVCVLACALTASFVLGASAFAQSAVGRVALRVTVPPRAVIDDRRPLGRQVSADTVDFAVHLIVRATATYRLVARRTAGTRATVLFVRAGEAVARLDQDRSVVQVARGEDGLTSFEIHYRIACAADPRGCGASDAIPELVVFEVWADGSTSRP